MVSRYFKAKWAIRQQYKKCFIAHMHVMSKTTLPEANQSKETKKHGESKPIKHNTFTRLKKVYICSTNGRLKDG